MRPPTLQDVIELTFPATLDADGAASTAVHDRVLALFDECAPGLRRYVGSFDLSPTVTEDIVQDVFLALFRHLTLGRPSTNLKGWVFQVAHNLALKHRQRAMKRGLIERAWSIAAADRLADDAMNPEERFAETERQQRLTRILRSMPERDQRCIYLRAEGLCYRDVAKILGVSLGAVAKSVARAVARLAAGA
jgi:RNA polymerase sigma-70 factor (ECF subfamily)